MRAAGRGRPGHVPWSGAVPAKPSPNDAYGYLHTGFYTYLRLLTHAAPSEQLRSSRNRSPRAVALRHFLDSLLRAGIVYRAKPALIAVVAATMPYEV